MKENNKMKKLMIAVAIVCAAALSQAATISWGSANMYKASSKDGGWSSTSFKSGKIDATMSVFLLGTEDYATVSKMSTADMYAWAKEQTPTYPVTHNNDGATFKSSITIYDENGVGGKTYNSIILAEYTDKDYGDMYMVRAMSDTANAQGNLDFTDIFGGTTPAYTGGWVAASSDVPEPTSGLLLVLGLGALALKRKRA